MSGSRPWSSCRNGRLTPQGIILLAATNRPEVLDQALLRPGRFDRRIIIDRPNLAGRLATLQVHTRNIKLAEDVNLKKVALATAGCVGARIASLVNEAALRAVQGPQAGDQETCWPPSGWSSPARRKKAVS